MERDHSERDPRVLDDDGAENVGEEGAEPGIVEEPKAVGDGVRDGPPVERAEAVGASGSRPKATTAPALAPA